MGTPQANHVFAQIPHAQIQRSSFNRSHNRKTTMDSGFIEPIFADELLPGDTFNLNLSAFGRLTTPITPIMDNLYLDVFFFAVPNRLVWQHWEQFNGAQANPGDSTSYLNPYVSLADGDLTVNSIWDKFGLPIGASHGGTVTGTIQANAFFPRAYNLIYNEWFRDQNLINSATVNTGDGPDTASAYGLLRRGKRHDYFTSCLPWPQKGPAVTLSFGGQAPIKGTTADAHGRSIVNFTYNQATYSNMDITAATTGALTAGGSNPTASGTPLSWPLLTDPSYNYADLSQATASTINQIRQAFQIQRMYERDARGGTRYTEIVKSHFGVTSPDARLQRPEFLTGGSFPIVFSSVPQTAPTQTGETPQGNLAAYATVATANRCSFTYSATEHMVLIGLASVRADYTYQSGLERMWSRSTRFDYFWPTLAHLGEQAVLNQEIWCVGNGTTSDTLAFGYQERFAEYRYKPNSITGLFRSGVTQSLDYWHLAQHFTTLPTLGQTFIEENPPVARTVAITTQPQFIMDYVFNLKCARPMPLYSVPGYVDHF